MNNGLVKLKMRVFELLSALCVYSTEGHHTALDVLEDYKVGHILDIWCGYIVPLVQSVFNLELPIMSYCVHIVHL